MEVNITIKVSGSPSGMVITIYESNKIVLHTTRQGFHQFCEALYEVEEQINTLPKERG